MAEGMILERGAHNELVNADGTYAEMWRKQKEAADEIQKIQKILGTDGISTIQI